MDRNEYLYAAEEIRDEMEAYIDEMDSRNGLSLTTTDDVMNYVKEHDVSSVRLWFSDILGFVKSFSITPKELEGAFEEGMGFDGSSIKGYKRIQESDMVAVPVPETAQALPFRSGGARALRLFAQIRNPDGSPYDGDPRNILMNTLGRLEDHDCTTMYVGPEAEYFYFKNEHGTELLDSAGYFDINPVDIGDDIRELTICALEAMGIVIEYHHHEVGPSQHEIDIRFKDALGMADDLQTYKYLVKEMARRCGAFATFMPKPLAGENGSGMHTHLSLFNGSENAFYDGSDEHHLSAMAKHFIAGVLTHAREMALVTNPTHNSYRRLVPGYEAPVYIAWAERNRSAAIRIPMYKPGKEVATRIELRFPDPTCNPYLTFAVMLAAGLAGVENKMACPDPVQVDIYHLTAKWREQMGIDALPHDLFEAARIGQASGFLKDALGEDVHRKLVETKMAEADVFRLHVSQLDLAKHLVL